MACKTIRALKMVCLMVGQEEDGVGSYLKKFTARLDKKAAASGSNCR